MYFLLLLEGKGPKKSIVILSNGLHFGSGIGCKHPAGFHCDFLFIWHWWHDLINAFTSFTNVGQKYFI